MLKLDSFVEREGIRSVDLVKIDTETTEPEVIAGAKQTIARFRPMIICEVLRGKTGNRLQELMDGFSGYRYSWITENGLLPRPRIIGDNRNMNYLFIPEKKIHRIPG